MVPVLALLGRCEKEGERGETKPLGPWKQGTCPLKLEGISLSSLSAERATLWGRLGRVDSSVSHLLSQHLSSLPLSPGALS